MEVKNYGLISKKKYVIPKHIKKNLSKTENENFDRVPSNSTSSIYITSTLNNPNHDELTKCVTTCFYNHIKQGHLENYEIEENNIFSEKLFPLTDENDNDHCPNIEKVFCFIDKIFKTEQVNN
eukprot:TRINITY_DN7313_c0_g1_i1.p1 TRINITY_DN7313_c0_g1~~TRINITY_DN7313_c0_g1_i1.p1  ORF type:complete len:123 (-),score=29.41 TRINITY_DN7313_c0_g1_i1:567-935(-)